MKMIKLALVAMFFVFVFTALSLAEDAVLKIVTVKGNVLVKIHPSEEWVGVKLGQALNQKDSIKTEADGRVYLEFADKSSLSLKPDTEVTTEELILDAKARKINVVLKAGQLRTIVNKVNKPSEFKVKTPTAICGVRGTKLYLKVSDIETRSYAEGGIIDFTNTTSGESQEVGDGMTSVSSVDGSISDPEPIPGDIKDDITSGYLDGPVAEPYTEPVTDERTATDITAPEVTEETPASPV